LKEEEEEEEEEERQHNTSCRRWRIKDIKTPKSRNNKD